MSKKDKTEPIRITKYELFKQQAPSFNFELDADQLLAKALKDGYVKEIGIMETIADEYYLNEDYESEYGGVIKYLVSIGTSIDVAYDNAEFDDQFKCSYCDKFFHDAVELREGNGAYFCESEQCINSHVHNFSEPIEVKEVK
jgi:hypothetical protein